jgi:DNA-directed RNA polymerase specialized sigma24 family protein
VLDEGALQGTDSSSTELGIAQIADEMATPELQAMLTEELHRRLDGLPDDRCRSVALLRLEGWRVAEIAENLDCPKRVVERLLNLIRKCWS